MTVAGLPMYDLPELGAATAAWWEGLARAFRAEGLRDVPDRLSLDLPYREMWARPDLLFGQACGYPLMHAFRGRLAVVATPCYDAPGCEGAHYRSVVIVRDGSPAACLADLEGARAAYNAKDSQSGYNALRWLLAPLAKNGRFLAGTVETGSHLASIAAVRESDADLAAIDGVVYALLMRHRPDLLYGTRIIAAGPPAPSLPYVTAAGRAPEDLARLRAGLKEALADPALSWARGALLIAGAEILPDDAYDVILAQEREAMERGYGELA
jgi:ABC-type phosphate/phosphonate transport system substrate-binding protein